MCHAKISALSKGMVLISSLDFIFHNNTVNELQDVIINDINYSMWFLVLHCDGLCYSTAHLV